MSDELLKAATRALKDEGDAEPADGRFTRARVMASLHQSKVKRRTRLAFVLPLAACLAAGTAWAGATGKLPAVFHAITQAVSFESPRPARPARKSSPVAKPSSEVAPRSDVPALPASEPSEPEVVPKASPEPQRKERSPALAPAPSASSSGAVPDRDGDLYRVAHEAHFTGHDYARALPAWDAYLRAAPNGRLATEARYNRAICLLRLGRTREARTALTPFALGALGYRQAEARQLLDELPE